MSRRERSGAAGSGGSGRGTAAGRAEAPARPRRRRLWTGLALLALLLAAAAHAWFWYAPRLRPAVPDPDDLPGRLLASGRLPVALWIPHPHQNLGVLSRAVGSVEERRELLAAAARLAGLPRPTLPRFGPFQVPPARELVALSDESGERVLVAARIHPLVAGLARAAGAVAGNPWLAGGEVDAFGGAATVAWDGTLWTVGNVAPEEVLTPRSPPAAAPPRSLAALRLARPVSFLPAGTVRLHSTARGLEARTTGADTLPRDPADRVTAGAALLAVSGPGGPLERGGGGALAEAGSGTGRGAFALLLPEDGGAAEGEGLEGLLAELPGAAVWYLPGGERFRLPAERLLAGSARGAGNSEGWALVATSRGSLRRAERLTPVVERLAPAVSLAVYADPAPALATVDRVADLLEVVPLAPREELERWRDWRTVLSPLAEFHRLSLTSVRSDGAAPAAARLVLLREGGSGGGPEAPD